jgi:hypothetical protein
MAQPDVAKDGGRIVASEATPIIGSALILTLFLAEKLPYSRDSLFWGRGMTDKNGQFAWRHIFDDPIGNQYYPIPELKVHRCHLVGELFMAAQSIGYSQECLCFRGWCEWDDVTVSDQQNGAIPDA